MSKKFQLSNDGEQVYPKYKGKKWVSDTWKRKAVDDRLLEEVATIESTPAKAPEKIVLLEWSNTYSNDQFGTTLQGVEKTKSEWINELGSKYVRACIGKGILS